jgi:protease I
MPTGVAMKALIVSADHFEDSELLFPFYRLKEEGLEVDIASIARGKITGKHGYEVAVDKALRDIDPKAYDLLILPGGKAPGKLRKEPAAIAIAQHFMLSNKPVAAICHGPQILITAGVLQGRRATCYHSVAEELKASGALYEDKAVVVDGKLITSRQPSDLPDFMREMVRLLGNKTR